jgi:hypothetical protein
MKMGNRDHHNRTICTQRVVAIGTTLGTIKAL